MQLRLIGLMLFVTTIFLALSAAATKTATIQVKRPEWRQRASQTDEGPGASDGPASQTSQDAQLPGGPPLEFVSVPIVWPLAASGSLGLMLWFFPAVFTNTSQPPRRKSKKRRK